MPGLPVLHDLREFAQTHVHWVDDAIQQSHPLSTPSPPALNFSQHQNKYKREILKKKNMLYMSYEYDMVITPWIENNKNEYNMLIIPWAEMKEEIHPLTF